MVKLIIKEYRKKTATVNHICKECNQAIKKYYLYMKNDKEGIRLHIHCFNKLSLDSIEKTVQNMKDSTK